MTSRLFDIVALAFAPGPESARSEFEQLVERYSPGSRPEWGKTGHTLFHSVDGSTAAEILNGLDSIGVRTEIRPAAPRSEPVAPPPAAEFDGPACPACGVVNPESSSDCLACGVVFAKYEQRAVRQMMIEAKLEQELNKAQQIQQEWDDKANRYLQGHPLPAGATSPFSATLQTSEIPFLSLQTDSGPMLLTSKRILASAKATTLTIPYEMIAGVELGGGFTLLGGSVRMVMTFKAPLLLDRSRTSTLTRQIEKNTSFDRETILDWAYSKNFICSGCGARDLAYRFENLSSKARCMRCAADHLIDLTNAVAKPTGEPTL